MRPVAYDVLRLLLGPFSQTPRGIDRIDLGCALRLLKDPSIDCMGLLPTPVTTRWFRREQITQFEAYYDRMWGEDITSRPDAAFERVRNWLLGLPHADIKRRQRNKHYENFLGLCRLYAMLWQHSWSPGGSLATLPRNALYLNIGQLGLSRPRLLEWLDARSDVAPMFMIHDVIPLSHPELVSSGNTSLHERVMTSAIRYGRALLTPSEAARAAVEEELHRRGAASLPVYATPLPINEIFLRPEQPDQKLASRPYFVVCGAVETRKNHILLLRAWREIDRRFGPDAPRLVIAGSLGWGCAEVLEYLDRNPKVRRHVILAEGMSTIGIKRLMSSARAVLTPSFAEGFGLPPIEALAAGAPSVLSDIPSHREGAGAFGIYLDPSDLEGWTDRIVRLTEDETEYRTLRAGVAGFRATSWSEYGERLKSVLSLVD